MASLEHEGAAAPPVTRPARVTTARGAPSIFGQPIAAVGTAHAVAVVEVIDKIRCVVAAAAAAGRH